MFCSSNIYHCSWFLLFVMCCCMHITINFCFYGSSRSSTCVPNVWSSGYAGMTLSETQKLSTGPTFPVFRISSPRDEIHCSAMWWDLMTTCQPTAHYHRSQQQELAPALVLVGGDGQHAHATHGSSRLATVHPSAFVLNGPRVVVVATLGWRNGPLLSTWSDDDDDDDDPALVQPTASRGWALGRDPNNSDLSKEILWNQTSCWEAIPVKKELCFTKAVLIFVPKVLVSWHHRLAPTLTDLSHQPAFGRTINS